MQKRKKEKSSMGRFVIPLLLVIMMFFMFRVSYNAQITYPEGTVIKVEKGNTLAKFYQHLGSFDKMMMRLWLKNHKNLIPNLQEGAYILSGNYGKGELLSKIAEGPKQDYLRLTVLEGRSIYDIDKSLADKGLITAGDFIAQAQDQSLINDLKSDFSFLSELPTGKGLEGFLYPDTYFLDENKAIIPQLIKAQLKNFEIKIWTPFSDKMEYFEEYHPYQVLILASIIENEEKNDQNKPIIAGIFLERLKKGIQLGADVSLCYGLKLTYDDCHANIVPNLQDQNNVYNTRARTGLPPTPISSPSVSTLSALLQYQKTDYLYYLHDPQGGIHYGKTYEEHLVNKSKYL